LLKCFGVILILLRANWNFSFKNF